MWTAVLFGLGRAAAAPPADKPAAPAAAQAPALSEQEALAKYNEKKAQTPNTAAAQWKLAEWCEQNGLEAEAFVHYAAVVQLDPNRAAAWRKLGYKKHQGRWMTDAQIADDEEQTKANKAWGLRLKKIHKDIHRGPRVDEARAEAEAITDPRAVQAVYREFGARGPKDQTIAVQLLGQIDSPLSSKVLALMAIYGKTPDVRRRATETLRRRNPDDYLPLLVALLSDPVKYEVRPVGGPGSPGVLFVEGERANVRRVYAPPAPSVRYQFGDLIDYDAGGMPVLIRPFTHFSPPTAAKPGNATAAASAPSFDIVAAQRFSARDLMLEAQRGAISAQQQLQNDVDQIEALNNATKTFNEKVLSVARTACGQDHGTDPKDWRDALAAKGQYRKQPNKTPQKPTLDELAPLAYRPQFAELTFFRTPHFVVTDG